MADTPQAQEPSQNRGTSAETLSASGDRFITYSQSSGEIHYHDVERDFIAGNGWAGHGEGKNNPAMERVKSVGPLPKGWYRIGPPENHPVVGPFALRLTPIFGTEMFGRDGFLIHGAAKDMDHYGQESKGCIVAARVCRERINALGVRRLQVIG